MRGAFAFALASIGAASAAADNASSCREAPTSECVLSQAIADAQRTPSPSSFHAAPSLSIVDALIKLGRVSEALNFAARIADGRMRDLALVNVVPALAAESEGAARRAVSLMQAPHLRQIALLRAAGAFAERDEFDAARRFAADIEEPLVQVYAWTFVSERSGDRALIARAWTKARTIAEARDRAHALAHVAAVSRDAAQLAEAMAAVRALDDPRRRADAMSVLARATGDEPLFRDAVADAHRAARHGRDRDAYRVLIHNLLAAARADLALEVAEKIPFNEARDPALADIAASFQAAGRYDDAERAALMMAGARAAALVLARVAAATKSDETRARAIATARRELLPYERAAALWQLGILFKRNDLVAEGVALAFSDESISERGKVLALLAPGLASTKTSPKR